MVHKQTEFGRSVRGNCWPATCCNPHNYKAMNSLSAETIIAVDTGNYTAWTPLTSLTSCITANGSLLVAAGRMAAVTAKATKSSRFRMRRREIR